MLSATLADVDEVVVISGNTRYLCDELELCAADVWPGDFVVDPHYGANRITQRVVRGRIIELVDVLGRAHVYNVRNLICVCRPVEVSA